MKRNIFGAAAVAAALSCSLAAQPARRMAVVTFHGPMPNSPIPWLENRLTEDVTQQLAGVPGLTLIDRGSINRVIREQNIQNNGRTEVETAARMGKLLGASQMVVVDVTNYSYSTHPEQEGNTTRTTGTVVLRANARMVNVETGVLESQQSAMFQESVPVKEISSSKGIVVGTIQLAAPKTSQTGGDPKVIAENERQRAVDSVGQELGAKIANVVSHAAPLKTAVPRVAGISNGAVYIDQGSNAGLKRGDRFQITRQVSIGLKGSDGRDLMKKDQVCILTIAEVNDDNASGNCLGGLPQSGDTAEGPQQ